MDMISGHSRAGVAAAVTLAVGLSFAGDQSSATGHTEIGASYSQGPAGLVRSEFLGGVRLSVGWEAKPLAPDWSHYDPFDLEGFLKRLPETETTVHAGREADSAANSGAASGVFGSVAIPMRNFPVSARWAPVYRAIGSCASAARCGAQNETLKGIAGSAKGKRFLAKLSTVNSNVNRIIAYRKDKAVYGNLDHWAKPAETLARRAGDCEDFVILKMAALAKAGIPARSMAMVVLHDRSRGVFHAVLAVSTGSGTFILDNVRNTVLRDTDLRDYTPLYSFSTNRAWIHGTRSSGEQVAALTGNIASVAPGEGPGLVAVRASSSTVSPVTVASAWQLRTTSY